MIRLVVEATGERPEAVEKRLSSFATTLLEEDREFEERMGKRGERVLKFPEKKKKD